MKIILASKSPRRAEILKNLGIDFTVRVSNVSETVPKDLISPEGIVKHLACEKALSMKDSLYSDEILIAADTLVFDGARRLGKPKNAIEAEKILKSLSGKGHKVITGLAVLTKEKLISDSVSTEVYFRNISDEEIHAYVATKEPLDKAGAYGIQGLGGAFVSEIRGDYFSVVGLPVCRLTEILKNDFNFDFLNN